MGGSGELIAEDRRWVRVRVGCNYISRGVHWTWATVRVWLGLGFRIRYKSSELGEV